MIEVVRPVRFAPPPADATHWSLLFLGNGSDRLRVAEIEMAASPGGADLCTGGTVISGGPASWGSPGNAFDNNTGTEANGTDGTVGGMWLGYAFAAAVSPREIRIRASAAVPNEAPTVAVLRYSLDSGTTWISTDWIIFPTAWTAGQVRAAAVAAAPLPVNVRSRARAWRCWVQAVQSGTIINCGELEFATSPGGATVAAGGAAISSSNLLLPSNGPGDAFDGTKAFSNLWQSATPGVPGWIGYAWPTPQPSLVEMRWTAGPFGPGEIGPNPETLRIQWTSDGQTWVQTNEYAGIAAWPDVNPPPTRAYAIA